MIFGAPSGVAGETCIFATRAGIGVFKRHRAEYYRLLNAVRLACDMGVRKKPSEERGPKLKSAIRQPHTTTTAGVRHPRLRCMGAEEQEDDAETFAEKFPPPVTE